MKKILFFLILALFASQTLAWTISPELKKEIEQKKAAVAQKPKDPQARFDLAITYAYTNHIEEGFDELKTVNELDPSFKNKALDIYVAKVNQNPNDWKLRFRMAFAYYVYNIENNNGLKDKTAYKKAAIRELNNVLLLDPENVWAYGYIALIYGEMNEVDTAIKYAKEGLAIDSNVAALHLLLGEGYKKKGWGFKGWIETAEALRLRALGY